MSKKTFFRQDIYPAPANFFLSKVKSIDVMIKSAKPIIKYVRIDNDASNEMTEGHTYVFNAKLFSIFSLGKYTIEIIKMDDSHIYSKTSFDIAKVWIHYADIKAVDENHTMLTHQIDLDAGWKTPFIYWVLKIFYRNNKNKYSKMISKMNKG